MDERGRCWIELLESCSPEVPDPPTGSTNVVVPRRMGGWDEDVDPYRSPWLEDNNSTTALSSADFPTKFGDAGFIDVNRWLCASQHKCRSHHLMSPDGGGEGSLGRVVVETGG